MVFMTTFGGNPNAAYRIARAIQCHYKLENRTDKGSFERSERQFYLFVDSLCLSAGTLVALGATHLVLSDYAELGPLDVQLQRPDEPTERDSGLTPSQALTSLERRSISLFNAHFEQLRNSREISLTTRTAVENAANITSGLMRSIYGQIDPMRLGEVERLMEIVAQYGNRLGKFNVKPKTIARLLTGYPSHSFVIDRREARDLFNNVEIPKATVRELGERWRLSAEAQKTPIHFYFTPEAEASFDEQEETENDGKNTRSRRGGKAGTSKGDAKNGGSGSDGG